jgi:PGF-pre-PGF domain-containing protein
VTHTCTYGLTVEPAVPIPENTVVASSPTATVSSASAGVPENVPVENTNITQLTITTNTTVENVGVTVQQLAGMPASISIGAPGVAYQYFNVSVENLSDAQIENVVVDFQVAMSWITSNGIDVSTITLNRYDPTTASWTALPTTLLSEDNTYAYFSAVSPGLSVFEVLGQPTPTTTTPPTTTPPTTTPPTTTTAPPSGVWIWVAVVIVVIVVIAIVAWALTRRKKKRRKKKRKKTHAK